MTAMYEVYRIENREVEHFQYVTSMTSLPPLHDSRREAEKRAEELTRANPSGDQYSVREVYGG